MKRQTLYATVSLLVVASALFAACLGPRKATPTPTPVWPLPLPTNPPTPTPGPTPTPLPPDRVVPEGVVSPVVIQHSPLPGEELPLDGAVELVFDRAMDKTSVQEAFEVSASHQCAKIILNPWE